MQRFLLEPSVPARRKSLRRPVSAIVSSDRKVAAASFSGTGCGRESVTSTATTVGAAFRATAVAGYAARTACRAWASRPGSDSARTASCDGTTARSDSSSVPIPPAGYVRLSAAELPPSVADAITNPLSPKLRFSCSSSSPPPTKISTAAAAAAIRGQYLRNTEIRGAGVFSSRSRRAHPSAGGVTSASRSALRITSVQSLFCFII